MVTHDSMGPLLFSVHRTLHKLYLINLVPWEVASPIILSLIDVNVETKRGYLTLVD